MKGCLGEFVGVVGLIGVIVILCKTGHWEIVLGVGVGIGILVWLISGRWGSVGTGPERGKHYDVAMALYKNGGVNESVMLKHGSGNCNAFSYAALSINDDAGRPLLDAMFKDQKSRKADGKGMTPLMFASKFGNVLAVRAIRKTFGRDEKKWREYVNQTCVKGLLGRDKKSALDMAGSQEIKMLLQEDLTMQTKDSIQR